MRPRSHSTTRAPSDAAGAFVALTLLAAALGACAPYSYWARHSAEGVRYARSPAAERLVQRARELELATDRGWIKLGHYRRDAFGGPYRSEADGVEFFLAPTGKYDPEAELEATIRALLAPPAALDEASLNKHPVCRFPARVLYLSQKIGLAQADLGVQRCPHLEKFMAQMDPGRATLIFSSYYMNNPASAFGHTFLRIRKRGSLAVGKKRELLDYGIDFSADVTNSNPIVYTVMGLSGGFRGTFKRVPYYYKVREYNDVESRDLWEYDLDFSPFELALLVAHVWEVGGTYFDYFYLGENCSYAILGLLEVAKPELTMMEQITSPVVPAATVQVLFTQPGLVREVRYRPSLRTQLNKRLAGFSAQEKDLVEALSDDPEVTLPLPEDRAIEVLDAAVDLVDIRFAKELLVDRDEHEAAQLKQSLLERRAAIRVASPSLEVLGRPEKAPEQGHAARRVGVGGGRDAGGNPFVALDARVALHDLADPSDGYLDGSQIEFLTMRLRFGEIGERLRVRVDHADIVRVTSLTSFERFDKHISFQFNIGLRGIDQPSCELCSVGHMQIGGGLAKSFLDDAIYMWALGDSELFVGAPLREGSPVPLRVGGGPSAGLRLRFHPRLILLGTGHWYAFPGQEPSSLYQADVVLRYGLSRNWAISAEGRLEREGLTGQGVLFSYF